MHVARVRKRVRVRRFTRERKLRKTDVGVWTRGSPQETSRTCRQLCCATPVYPTSSARLPRFLLQTSFRRLKWESEVPHLILQLDSAARGRKCRRHRREREEGMRGGTTLSLPRLHRRPLALVLARKDRLPSRNGCYWLTRESRGRIRSEDERHSTT